MTRPSPPPARNLGDAIEASASLAGLLQGHQRSQRCFAAIKPQLPTALRPLVRPGPIDGSTWTLLAENASAAAKLRQCAPDLLAAASACEPSIRELKLKILPKQASVP